MRNPENRRSTVGIISAPLALAILAGAPALADDTRIALLESRLQALEERPESTSASTLTLPGGSTLTVYGFAKGDLIFDQNHRLGDTIFGIVGVNAGDPRQSGTTLHARQSRFGFTIKTPTPLGEATTRIEGDFFGGGNAFRLRHAYGELSGFLVGQTWGLFMPIESYPSTLDFQGPAGLPFTRVAQIRYTHKIDNLTLAASIERNGGNRSPIFTGAVSYSFDNAFVKLAALTRQVDHPTGKTSGWGVNLSGNAQLWAGGSINASYTDGRAIASLMVFGDGAAGADIMGPLENYRAVRTRGLSVGVTQDVTDQIGIGLVYGERRNGDNPNAAATDTAKLQTVHATATWKPVDNVTTGLETIFARREQIDGGRVNNTRLQLSTTFSF